jgi:hypothetical protein
MSMIRFKKKADKCLEGDLRNALEFSSFFSRRDICAGERFKRL